MQIKELIVKVSNWKGKNVHVLIYFSIHVATCIYIFVLKPFDCHQWPSKKKKLGWATKISR